MCGRFTLAVPDRVEEFFQLAGVPELKPRYNIAPTQPAPVVRLDAEKQERRLCMLHWGLIPYWAGDPAVGGRMINARSETVTARPAFRNAFKKRRCLVIADGFYEWQKKPGEKRKQPYYIRMRDETPFAFAGLWERWTGPDQAVIESCTVLTTGPNELMQPLHNRMPVILPRENYDAWLHPLTPSAARLEAMCRPFDSDAMIAFPVSTLVNSPANDQPACIEPEGGLFDTR